MAFLKLDSVTVRTRSVVGSSSMNVHLDLAEFEYRFNRRFDLSEAIPRLVYIALRIPRMPERLLKLRLA